MRIFILVLFFIENMKRLPLQEAGVAEENEDTSKHTLYSWTFSHWGPCSLQLLQHLAVSGGTKPAACSQLSCAFISSQLQSTVAGFAWPYLNHINVLSSTTCLLVFPLNIAGQLSPSLALFLPPPPPSLHIYINYHCKQFVYNYQAVG